MLSDEIRERVEKATVQLPKRGQGVVVRDGLILTAAHCIEWSSEGEMIDMALGKYFLETVECAGREITAQVLAVEPVLDIAVLGAPDDQEFYEQATAYDMMLELIVPVDIYTKEFNLFEDVPVAIYTHKGTWIETKAQQCAYWIRRAREPHLQGATVGASDIPAKRPSRGSPSILDDDEPDLVLRAAADLPHDVRDRRSDAGTSQNDAHDPQRICGLHAIGHTNRIRPHRSTAPTDSGAASLCSNVLVSRRQHNYSVIDSPVPRVDTTRSPHLRALFATMPR